MPDTNTAAPPTPAAPTTRTRTPARPTVSARPLLVGAANTALIAGATVVAAGGGPILAAGGAAVALAGTAAAGRKTGQARAERRTTTRTTGSRTTGTTGRTAATPGGRSPAGRSATPGRARSGGASGSGLGSLLRGGGRAGGSGGTPTGRGSRTGGGGGGNHRAGGAGHRRAGTTSGSNKRAPLTADRVAAARRKLAARRMPGPRMSDAVRNATTPNPGGHKPTTREAFAAARRAVTGANPKNRGTVRRAAAGLTAGLIAAAKVRREQRKARLRAEAARKRMEAARKAKQARATAAAQNRTPVRTAVRRPVGAPSPQPTSRKPAPPPTARRTPGTATPPTVATNKGTITMVNPLLIASEEFLQACTRHHAEGMLQVTAEAKLLPEIIDNLVQGLKVRYQIALNQPLHPDIKDMYGAMHKAQVAVKNSSEDIWPAIERVHALLLDRLRNPVVGEEMWDVARNRGMI